MAKSALKIRVEREAEVVVKQMTMLAQPRAVVETSARYIAQGVLFERPDLALKTIDDIIFPKTKNEGRIRVHIARQAYCRYPVPKFLLDLWDNNTISWTTRFHRPQPHPRLTARNVDLRWFFCAASGGSLYREITKDFMTKKETHAFLNCREDINADQAVIFALAKSHTDSIGTIRRLYLLEKMKGLDFKSERNRDILRFFATNLCDSSVMNDLIDYIQHAFRENPLYSLRGRTIDSLRVNAEVWHRTLRTRKEYDGAVWQPSGLREAIYDQVKSPTDDRLSDWVIEELTTGERLALEGEAMHHCVLSYKTRCLSGEISIWSVSRRIDGKWKRALTMEVRHDSMAIVQIRGFANRLADRDEMAVVKRWAQENRLAL